MTDVPSVSTNGFDGQRKLRLAYFVSHPIQYQAGQLKRIAEEPDIDLKVFFSSNISVREHGYADAGFGVQVKWDIGLLEGYNYEFLPVLHEGKQLGFASPLNFGVAKRIREQGFDAIWLHGYSTLTNLRAILAANSAEIPVLLRTDSALFERPRSFAKLKVKKIFFDFLRPRVSGALAIGEANSEYWRHYLGEQMPLFQCLYAVDNHFFQAESKKASLNREELRKSLGLDQGRPIILFAAKLMSRKRAVDLLQAFLQLSRAGRIEPVPYLLIVGDGEERAVLENLAKCSTPGDVHFLGFRNQSELPRLYNLCDVFVLASVDEPWGLAINEVMNAGRAVIVSDQVGCQRDLVKHGVNGYVARALDVDDLAEGLRTVLTNEKTWKAMGAESLRIIQEFSFDQNVLGLRQALHALAPGFQAVRTK